MGLFSSLKNIGKKIGKQVIDPLNGDDFQSDAESLSAKEQQINAGGRQNGVDRIIAADKTPDIQDQEAPKKFGLLSGLKKAGKFVGDNADVILPSVYGLSQGVGVLPGLMYGLAARKQQQGDKDILGQKKELELSKIAQRQSEEDEMARQKELDRQNRLKLKTTLSGDSLKEEEEFKTYLEAKQIIDDLKSKGMKDEEIKSNYPDLNRIVYDYKQRKYYKRSSGDELYSDDPDNED